MLPRRNSSGFIIIIYVSTYIIRIISCINLCKALQLSGVRCLNLARIPSNDVGEIDTTTCGIV